MPIASSIVTITTSPTLIASLTTRASTDLLPITIRNDSGVDIYLGGPTVTTATGLRLTDGELIPFELGQSDELYGIVAAATAPLQLLRQRS